MPETIEVNKKALREILIALNRNNPTAVMELFHLRGFDESCPITILTKEFNSKEISRSNTVDSSTAFLDNFFKNHS